MPPSKVADELAALRAELEGLKHPAPPPPGPQWTGTQVLVRYAKTYWLSDPTPGPGTRVVPDGDPAAASLLGRGGLASHVDRGWTAWLRSLGCQFEELKG